MKCFILTKIYKKKFNVVVFKELVAIICFFRVSKPFDAIL